MFSHSLHDLNQQAYAAFQKAENCYNQDHGTVFYLQKSKSLNESALQIFDQLIAQDSRSWWHLHFRAMIKFYLQRYREALVDYSTCFELDRAKGGKDPNYGTHYWMSKTYFELGEFENALTNAQLSIDEAPDDARYAQKTKCLEALNQVTPSGEVINTFDMSDLGKGLESLFISTSDVVLGHELGRGGFGVVREALWQGTQVAVKQLIGQLTPDLIEEFKREIDVHARLRHPNITALYGICIEATRYAMVMEFMASGSLYDVLRNPAELPWSMRLSLALDLSSGLLYLHGQHIIHRDLKSLNILVDGQMRAKVSDFGLSKIKITTASMTKGAGGTPHWMAPELFDDAANSEASDVYATGIVFWELAARRLPYEGKNQMQIGRFVEKGNRETIPAGTPPLFSALMTRCWTQRAGDRPSMNDVACDMRLIQGGASATSSPSAKASSASSLDSGYAAFSKR